MIDMHSHILPNVDDGAKNLEETISLLQEAKQAGFTAIVSTSHYIEGYYEVLNSQRQKWIEQIEKEVLPIYLGNEIYLSENIINLLKENKACAINRTKYVLFELPLNSKPLGLLEEIAEMKIEGFRPILAHPERYTFIQENPKLVYTLIENEVLMQGNYGSIIGRYGSKAQILFKKLLENNMIHFLGTDVHRKGTIYPKMPEILEKLKAIIGKQKLEELSTINPKLVLENKDIIKQEPIEKIRFNLKEKLLMKIK